MEVVRCNGREGGEAERRCSELQALALVWGEHLQRLSLMGETQGSS